MPRDLVNLSLSRRAALGAALLAALPALAQSGSPSPVIEWARTSDRQRTRAAGFPAMGAKPSDDKAFLRSGRLRIAAAKRGERPKRLELTDYLPPVADQGEQSSCVGWSSAYYMYSYLVTRQLKLATSIVKEPRFQFSPAFVYNQANEGKNDGMPIEEGFKVLKERGCATLAEMPYDVKDFTKQPNQRAKERAERYRARQVVYLYEGRPRREPGTPNTEGIKTFLHEVRQPFVTGIPIFADFPKGPKPADFVYDLTVQPTKENFFGFHAITIIGYDDDRKAFRMVNSWGPAWGDRGFGWLSEAFIRNWAIDGFTVVAGGAIAREAAPGHWTPNVRIEEPRGSRPTGHRPTGR